LNPIIEIVCIGAKTPKTRIFDYSLFFLFFGVEKRARSKLSLKFQGQGAGSRRATIKKSGN
jgi:hypothetical protein